MPRARPSSPPPWLMRRHLWPSIVSYQQKRRQTHASVLHDHVRERAGAAEPPAVRNRVGRWPAARAAAAAVASAAASGVSRRGRIARASRAGEPATEQRLVEASRQVEGLLHGMAELRPGAWGAPPNWRAVQPAHPSFPGVSGGPPGAAHGRFPRVAVLQAGWRTRQWPRPRSGSFGVVGDWQDVPRSRCCAACRHALCRGWPFARAGVLGVLGRHLWQPLSGHRRGDGADQAGVAGAQTPDCWCSRSWPTWPGESRL